MVARTSRRVATAIVTAVVIAACGGSDDGAGDETDDVEDGAADGTGGSAGSAETASDSVTDTETGSIDWQPCDDLGIAGGSTPECATLTVPLDHADPGGETIEIALARLDTAPAGDQIGHVVFNPGGPGGSGLSFLEQAEFTIPAELQQRFDLVSFDPRGVGASTALECDVEIDDNVEILPAGDDAGWNDLVAEAEASLDDCTADTVELSTWVGTNNAARDLDLIRAALGDDGLTYVGYSYGTRLGATYAELFPENVRAMVLDAAVLPDSSLAELGLGQAQGFDRAFANFNDACAADADCLLNELGSASDVVDGLRAELDEVGEFPAGSDRVLTRGELELGIIAALYSKDAWPFLDQALYVADTQQDGELLQVLGDNLVGRQPDGTYDNSGVANGFINCADDPARPSVDETRAEAEAAAALSEMFGDALRADTGCIGVPAATDPLVIGPATGASSILVIGSTGDPATPYEWSVELADLLDSATLFTVEAEGHTSYGSIDCVAEPVNRYLIDLEVPSTTECSDNASADFFPSADDDQIKILLDLFDCLRDNGADIPELTAADILADPTGEGLAEYLDPSRPGVIDAFNACLDQLEDLQASL